MTVHVIVGLETLFAKRKIGHINLLPEDLVLGGSAFSRDFGSDRILEFILSEHRSFRVWLFSPYSPRETTLLLSRLREEAVREPPPLLGAGGKSRHPWIANVLSQVPRRLDRVLIRAMSRRNIPVERSVVVDHRRGFGGLLDRNRVDDSRANAQTLSRHLRRIARWRGDLREKNLTLVREDYADADRARCEKWASGLSFPPDSFARSKDESLLCLDLDHTLIAKDSVPISLDGQRAYYEALALQGYFIPKSDRVRTRARPHDFVVGDHGFWIRPGIEELMRTAKASFDRICLYTAATETYAGTILSKALPAALTPDFILHSKHTFKDRMYDPPGKTVLVPRALGYAPGRILAIDDSPSTWEFSRRNIISINSYYGASDDRTLFDLVDEIERLGRLRDIRRATFKRVFLPSKRSGD